MGAGIAVAILAAIAALAGLVATTSSLTVAAVYLGFGALALACTVPPMKLSHRGLGELTLALTHGAGAILAGYVVQAGGFIDSRLWLLALPLCLAVMPSILLAGFPDHDADAAAGKRTLVIRLGRRNAVRLAIACGLGAPLVAAMVVLLREDVGSLLLWSMAGGALHAIWMARFLWRLQRGRMSERIDGAIVGALLFILWSCVAPLVVLIRTQ